MSKLSKEKKWAGRLRELVTNDNEFLKLAEFLDECDSTEFSYQVNMLASLLDPLNYHPTFKNSLEEYMEHYNINFTAIYKALGVDKKGYESIAECVTLLTESQAEEIAKIFQRPAKFWMELQKTYKKKNHSNVILEKRKAEAPRVKVPLDRDIW